MIRPSILRFLPAVAAVALITAVSALASGSPNPWENIQVGVSYRMYQPKVTLGMKLKKVKPIDCGQGQEPWGAGTYGTKKRGFALYEGHPICSDPAESTKVGSPKIQGVKAYLGVYCTPPAKCKIAQGVKNGYTLQWTAKPSKPYKKNTQMQLDSYHLTLAQVLKIAKHLKSVG